MDKYILRDESFFGEPDIEYKDRMSAVSGIKDSRKSFPGTRYSLYHIIEHKLSEDEINHPVNDEKLLKKYNKYVKANKDCHISFGSWALQNKGK